MDSSGADRKREFSHPGSGHAKKKHPPRLYIEPITAFYVFLAANVVSACFAPIQDCDETFNYWEPTHYLLQRYGRQTWEYAPEHAIRSWLYVALHAVVGAVRYLLPRPDKVAVFYTVRYALAFVCALGQTLLWRAIASTLNPRIGLLFILATVFSPGTFHASTAYLPSSFAMYATMMGVAAFMDWRGGFKTVRGVVWFAVGAVVGWPFAGALCAPFVLEEVVLMLFGTKKDVLVTVFRLVRGAAYSIAILSLDSLLNSILYRKLVVIPWNIVKYNLFSSGGPELYGVEAWDFYFRNLLLNFNIWFPLALVAAPLFAMQKILGSSGHGLRSGLRTFVFLSPFYLWLAIFTAQPHKEERFMYPAYPLLALNASVSFHILLSGLGRVATGSRLAARIKLLLVAATILLSVLAGLARTYGVYEAYSAPLSVYARLWRPNRFGPVVSTKPQDVVCVGKEWYRFPSSFFLPRPVHLKFVDSEFRGLLPGEFSEMGSRWAAGTWMPTEGLNDRNEWNPDMLVNISECRFLVDTQYPEHDDLSLPSREPDYVADAVTWEEIQCEPFLDAAKTSAIPRALWLPDFGFLPDHLRRKWGRHCLLRRR